MKKLYNFNRSGKVLVWWVEVHNSEFHTFFGQDGGKIQKKVTQFC